MLLVTVKYEDKRDGLDVILQRNVDDNANLHMVIGEVLYGVEQQSHLFVTKDIYDEVIDAVPVSYKKNCTICDMPIENENNLKITVTKKASKK